MEKKKLWENSCVIIMCPSGRYHHGFNFLLKEKKKKKKKER